jgi:acyl transferase domain-containing protein/acyl carrier protein
MNEFYERINNLSQKRLVLLAMELQSRLEAVENAQKTPDFQDHLIAVIGMGCRFPGGANSPEAFWQLLLEGRDAISEIPNDRWNVQAYYDPEVEASGKMSTRWGGFMSQIDQFDPALFGITPREAATMDPQQRIMLEVCWEALERAGYAPDRLSGSATGVFVGACNSDYAQLLMIEGLENADMYLATGGAHSVISGRVSYVFGLQGPSISIDTACSSSLVAIHYAIKSLRTGECRMALAGGVNVIVSPDVTVTLSKANMMAADGRCKTFDSTADGFVRSEGCGMLVLKRLKDAIADGDNILAVIRGSAINQDGRSNGLTAPNGPSQVAVIRTALADADVSPAEINYVETHGTGTSLGDPIEAQALGAAFSAGRTKENPLMIGSVKTNLGHLESAAGVAGLMKLILILQHGEIPPHLHLHERSPHIPWDDLPLTVPISRTPWSGKRIGGTSSFGFSGTNVHIVVENYPPVEDLTSSPSRKRAFHLLTLSAKSEKSLQALVGRYERYIANQSMDNFADIAVASNTIRAQLPYRLAVVADGHDQARDKLGSFTTDPQSEAVLLSSAPVLRPPEVTFLFTGHGAQYVNMGKKLYESEPVFRQVLDLCNELAKSYLPQPLLDAFYPTKDSINPQAAMDTMTYGQPAIFALQVALAELWRSWGIQPAVVAGHSVGEYAAAVVAGIFSLEDGIKLVCARGRLMDHLPQTGSMAAVFATVEQVSEIIKPYRKEISIAVINAPTNIVISGLQPAVEAALAAFEAAEIKIRRLAIAQGAHSPLVDPMLDEFEQVAATVQFSAPRIDLISCTTGQPVNPAEVATPAYWRRHLRQPVQFARLMETLHERGMFVFLEIGPHPALLSIGQRVLPTGYGVWIPSLREKTDNIYQIIEACGVLYVNGVEVDWAKYYENDRPRKMNLPTYPFDHQRYWISSASKPTIQGVESLLSGISPLLERRINSPALEQTVFEGHLSAQWPAYLDHHRIFGTSIAPSPAYIEMALCAAEEMFGKGVYHLSNLAILEALVLPEDSLRTVQIIMNPTGVKSASFTIVSLDTSGQWKTHTTGEITPQEIIPQDDPVGVNELIAEVKNRCNEEITGPDYYAGVAALGLEFGDSFRGLQHVWRRDGEALGKIQLPESLKAEARKYRFHPALLDACFHLLGAPLPGGKVESAYLLIGIEHFRLYRTPDRVLWNHTTLVEQVGETFTGNIRLLDDAGNLVAEVQGLQLKRATRDLLLRAVRPRFDDWFYALEWQPRFLPPEKSSGRSPATSWCIVVGQNGYERVLQEFLASEFESFSTVRPGDEIPAGANVIYLAGLDASLGSTGSEVVDNQVTASLGVLKTLKMLTESRLWIITRGAQPVAQAAVDPAQAGLWGLGRVISLEHPDTWGGLFDLDPTLPFSEQVGNLVAEIRSMDIEDQVAYRQGQRYVARLVRTANPASSSYTFLPQASYLVTGGLGGLGLQTAHWMAENGARHIVLTGRHGLPERVDWDNLPTDSRESAQTKAILEIENTFNTHIDIVAVDVGDEGALQELLVSFGKSRPALKGIFHAAAVLGNRVLKELTTADLHAMFWPKIAGTWNLHNLTREMDLDFFVLFSSTTALLGSSQLAHYAAANTFMDAFAHFRHALGLPALSVNWGTWDVMRVASHAEQQRVAQFGLDQMPAQAALSILGKLLTSELPQITVASVDWMPLKAAYEARRVRPLLEGIESKKPLAISTSENQKALLSDLLLEIKPEERRQFIIDHVRHQVARVISASDPALLDIRQGLFEMGLDSLMSVELKGRLETSVGQPLPSTLTFNYPTISELARYLDEVVLTAVDSEAQPEDSTNKASTPDVPTEEIDDLSEDDLADLLASKLSKLK